MKNIFPRLLVLLLLVVITSFKSLFAQHYYYVVVGAFVNKENAQKFAGYVKSRLYGAHYALNTERKEFYVYVLKTTDHDEALLQTTRLQKESEFKDTWLFAGSLETITKNDNLPVIVQDSLPTPTHEEGPPIKSKADSSIYTIKPPESDLKVVYGKLFKFVIETIDNQPLEGEVHAVDYTLGRDLASYKANRYVDVVHSSHGKPMTLVCGIFGYKEVIKRIDYANPGLVGLTQDERGAWVVPYRLERMKKGDASVMYHVAFYKDAVIMLGSAKMELNELVNMMKSNTNYTIKIHGHCNGNHARRIIALGKSKNYFDIKGSEEVEGTAKQLSKLRAEAVQSYLSDHGIDKSRSHILGWGAADMLVSETSTSAKLNDRIEIEILGN